MQSHELVLAIGRPSELALTIGRPSELVLHSEMFPTLTQCSSVYVFELHVGGLGGGAGEHALEILRGFGRTLRWFGRPLEYNIGLEPASEPLAVSTSLPKPASQP